MKKNLLTLFFYFFLHYALAQPTINASIGTDEYGTGNGFMFGVGGVNWYMTFDDTFLYVAVMNANQTETATIYLDFDPLEIANGGDNSNGSLSGVSFDQYAPNLPFRADVALFAKNNYRQISQKNNSGAWVNTSSGDGAFSASSNDYTANFVAFNDNGNGSGGDDRREFKVAWTSMGLTGKPSAFNFLAFISYDNGGIGNQGIYAPIPQENPAGNINSTGANPNLVRYFRVLSTELPLSQTPFDKNSYTHLSGNESIGSIAVYDFILNNSGATITRSGNWTITNLIINQGNILLSTPADDTNISGNLWIGSSATLSLSSTFGSDLLLGGNFTNNGTFNCNDRAVFFNGTDSQSISGSTASTNFDFMIVNKTAGMVILNQAITVNNNNGFIELQQGKIDLNNNNIILAGLNSSINEDQDNNYIITDMTANNEASPGGYIRANNRLVSNSLTNIAGLGISLAHASTDYTVSIDRYHYRGDGKGIKKVYKLTGTPTESTLQISFAQDELADVPLDNNLSIFRFSNNIWENKGGTVDLPSRSVTVNGVNAFSDWTVGDGNNPLPVNLLSFTGQRISPTAIQLDWKTATEQNNRGFEIEQSNDALHFEKVAFVEGIGNTNTPQNYQFTLSEIEATYFRLKQIDFDGKSELSMVVFVEKPLQTDFVQIYPNPFSDKISLKHNLETNEGISVSIYDAQGRQVAFFQNSISALSQVLEDKLTHLAKGVYLVKINYQGTTMIQKILKE